MENGSQSDNSLFEKRIIYTKHSDQNVMIYILSDILKKQYAVVMTNFLYPDERTDLKSLDELFNDLVLDELNTPFMEWYPTIEEAISHHFEDFS